MDEDFLSKQFNKNLDNLLDENKSLDAEVIKNNEMLQFAEKIKSLDLSDESSIKESLKKKLLLLIEEKEKPGKSNQEKLEEDELSTEQLDYVAGGVSLKGAKFNKRQLNKLIYGDKKE